MPAMPATDRAPVTAPAWPPGRRGRAWSSRPFRGLRYDAARVSDLAAVTSPPYDVIDAGRRATHLEDLDPHNVVRLILPRDAGPAAPGRRATGRLRRRCRRSQEWQDEGMLRPRRAAGDLRLRAVAAADRSSAGLLAAVDLRRPGRPAWCCRTRT